MDDGVFKFLQYLVDNINTLKYLWVPFGILYPIYRRIVTDRRSDRREDQKDDYVNDLSKRLIGMQKRGDRALEDAARSEGVINTLKNEVLELKRQNDALRQANAALRQQRASAEKSHPPAS